MNLEEFVVQNVERERHALHDGSHLLPVVETRTERDRCEGAVELRAERVRIVLGRSLSHRGLREAGVGRGRGGVRTGDAVGCAQGWRRRGGGGERGAGLTFLPLASLEVSVTLVWSFLLRMRNEVIARKKSCGKRWGRGRVGDVARRWGPLI